MKYNELAVIKDGDTIKGFLVYDGKMTFFMDRKTAEKEAAAGNINELGYKNGRLMPISDIAGLKEQGLKGVDLKRYQKWLAHADLQDFVDCDASFQASDMEFAADKDVILAGIAAACGTSMSVMLIVSLYTAHEEMAERIENALQEWQNGISILKKAKRKGGFFIITVPMHDYKTNFDFFIFLRGLGLPIFNLDMMKTMKKRMAFMQSMSPFPIRIIMSKVAFHNEEINGLMDIQKQANEITYKELKQRMGKGKNDENQRSKREN